MSWRRELDGALESRAYRLDALSGGCVGDVYRVDVEGGDRFVAKVDDRCAGGLDVEADMLRYLATRSALPVPDVVYSSEQLLLMSWLPGRTGCTSAAQSHAAELLAALHGVTADRFGLDFATRIGGLVQPNDQCESWLEFFAERRLRFMARESVGAGRLDAATAKQVDRLADRLGEWLEEPEAPALLHGDLWSGNLLSDGDRVTGFIDPAIHYGHPEVELAFTTMFSTFSESFYAEYGERVGRPLGRDFFGERRVIYNAYPLLVHVRLFGGSYVQQLRAVLDRFVG